MPSPAKQSALYWMLFVLACLARPVFAATLTSATIQFNGDDFEWVYLNGTLLGSCVAGTCYTPGDTISLSIPTGLFNASGDNILAVRGEASDVWDNGVLWEMTLSYQECPSQTFESNGFNTVSFYAGNANGVLNLAPGWNNTGFNDSAWDIPFWGPAPPDAAMWWAAYSPDPNYPADGSNNVVPWMWGNNQDFNVVPNGSNPGDTYLFRQHFVLSCSAPVATVTPATPTPTFTPSGCLSGSNTITTAAGGGSSGKGDGGPATAAQLTNGGGVVWQGGNLYIADLYNCEIRKVNPAGTISLYGGVSCGFSGDGGPASQARFNQPAGLAVDAAGNMYVLDQGNQRIRKISATGVVGEVAGTGSSGYSGDNGPATAAAMNQPAGIALNPAGTVLYFSDRANCRIRAVDLASGVIRTAAGNGSCAYGGDNGPATSAQLNQPQGLAVDGAGNLYIADTNNCRVRKVNLSSGVITTVAGTGSCQTGSTGGLANGTPLQQPVSVALDSQGDLFITASNSLVLEVYTSGIMGKVAGNGTTGYSGDSGPATAAGLNNPKDMAFDAAGNLIFFDQQNSRVRKIQAVCNPTPTVTPTFTSTPVQTPSLTATPSPSPTPSPSSSATPTATLTPSPTSTATPTFSPTPSPTVTDTSSATPTATQPFSPTDSPTATFSPTPTPTFSPTLTATNSATSTATSTVTPSATSSPSFSATPSFSSTPSATASATQTPTFTYSPSITPTFSISPTFTPAPLGRASLRIFNAAGELVAAVAEGLGLYQVPMALKALNPAFAPDEGQQGMVELSGTGLIQAWNGRGDNGQLVESGTYTAQLAVRDGFGRVTTFMTALQVLRQSNRILLQIYNSAGERVRQAGLTMTAGTLPALDSLALDRDSFLPGAGQDLKISFGNGAGNFWFWDGNSDSGQAVRSGIYMIKVSAADSSGGPRTYSRTVTVLGLPGPNLSKAAAFPNPVAGGQAMVIRLAGPGQTLAPGIRVEASCHNLGGEMVSRADNGADPGFVTFDTRGMASGIYLVSLRRMGQEAGGGTTILKIAVFK